MSIGLAVQILRGGVLQALMIAAPLLHDTSDEIAQPLGEVRDWRAGECEPVPGQTMPKLIVVARDYPHVGEQWRALGPLVEQLGTAVKGASWGSIKALFR